MTNTSISYCIVLACPEFILQQEVALKRPFKWYYHTGFNSLKPACPLYALVRTPDDVFFPNQEVIAEPVRTI